MSSENFIWGLPRNKESEGSIAQKMPVSPTTSHNSQTSTLHTQQISKDFNNSLSAAHANSKTEGEKNGIALSGLAQLVGHQLTK